MSKRDLMYIHYWKTQVSNDELQAWLDKQALYSSKAWCILLDEKLRRNEC